MAMTALKGNPVNTNGNLPSNGQKAPDAVLVKKDLSEGSINSYSGKTLILNIFPSIDTATCAMSVRKFNQEAASLSNAVVLCISADLPFAQSRFCGAEGIDKVETLSSFRSDFAEKYGVKMIDGPLKGLCARSVVVINPKGDAVYSQLVGEIADEPDYAKALEAAKNA